MTTTASKVKLLLVDDDHSMRHCLELFFLKDYNVYLASNGQDALELLKTHGAEIVLTDINLPIMDGAELCRKIRQIGLRCKIYAMSGDNNSLENLKAIDIGFDGFVNKPFDLVEVKELLRQGEEELLKEKKKR